MKLILLLLLLILKVNLILNIKALISDDNTINSVIENSDSIQIPNKVITELSDLKSDSVISQENT